MHCTQVVWPASPIPHDITAVAASLDEYYTAAEDGAVAKWEHVPAPQCHQHEGVQPTMLLWQHKAAVRVIMCNLTGVDGVTYMLTADADGWCCIWNEQTYDCVDYKQALPITLGSSVEANLLPDGQHVGIIVAPHVQQAVADHAQQPSQPLSLTRAPAVLVLNWQTLVLVAAPLASALGPCLQTAGLPEDGVDRVVCSSVSSSSTTSSSSSWPDPVLYAVSASGWMFAATLAGQHVAQAWHQSLVNTGSGAPLLSGAMTASSFGMLLLLVQPSGWHLLHSDRLDHPTGIAVNWQSAAHCRVSQPQLPVSMPHHHQDSSSSSNEQPRAGRVRFIDHASSDDTTMTHDASSKGLNNAASEVHRTAKCHNRDGSTNNSVHAGSSVGSSAPTANMPPLCGGQIVLLPSTSAPADQQGVLPVQHAAPSMADNASHPTSLPMADVKVLVWDQQGCLTVHSLTADGSCLAKHCYQAAFVGSHILTSAAARGSKVMCASMVHRSNEQCMASPHSSSCHIQVTHNYNCSASTREEDRFQMPLVLPLGCLDLHTSEQFHDAVLRVVDLREMQHHADYPAVEDSSSGNECTVASGSWSSMWGLPQTGSTDCPLDPSQHGNGPALGCRKRRLGTDLTNTSPANDAAHVLADDREIAKISCFVEAPADSGDDNTWRAKHPRLQDSADSNQSTGSYNGLHVSACDNNHAGLQDREDTASSSGQTGGHTAATASSHSMCVTQLSVVSSDQPGMKHIAAFMATGDILFYNLVAYCIPGVAGMCMTNALSYGDQRPIMQWPSVTHFPAATAHAGLLDGQVGSSTNLGSNTPATAAAAAADDATGAASCAPPPPVSCHVRGHLGPITCCMEVSFKRPPASLVFSPSAPRMHQQAGYSWPTSLSTSVAASAAPSPPPSNPASINPSRAGSMVELKDSMLFSQRSGSPSQWDSVTAGSQQQQQQQQQQSHANVSAAAALLSQAQDTPCLQRWLLTGGQDGSVCAWDLRVAHLGQCCLNVHPQTGAVQQFVLPPVHACLPWSSCILSLSADGSIAMICLATQQCHRVFGGYPHGLPLQVLWSVDRYKLPVLQPVSNATNWFVPPP
eukprot:jgi/Chrzof1/9820/Cz04g17100.t1